jgi:hypothetical protein
MIPDMFPYLVVLAAAPPPSSAQTSIINAFDALTTVGTAIALSVTAFFLLVGGFRYMTARGNPVQMERAKASLEHAAVGFGIIILARVLAELLQSAIHT